MDIPTTDPGLDLCYSATSDEEYETDGDIFGRGYRGRLMRKSPQLFGDSNILMPPELIITSAKKTDDELGDKSSSKVLEGSTTQSISEFPPININKRAKSWHSFNRCMATLKITSNSSQDAANTTSNNNTYDADSLQLKLSLKKQIWAGAWPGKNGIDRSRPLSWGVSSIGGSSKKATMINSHPRLQQEYDSESLLTACSQKLAAWQETERQNARGSTMGGDSNTSRKDQRKQVTLSASGATGHHQVKTVNEKVSKNRRNNTKEFTTPTKNLPEEQGKSKRKPKNSLTKIVKATDFFTHLAKSSKSTKSRDVPSSAALLAAPQSLVGALVSSHKPKSPSKFRTGAIVVTAVQPNKKSKKMRQGRHSKAHDTTDTDSENARTFVKKVRTKLKRKKGKGGSKQ